MTEWGNCAYHKGGEWWALGSSESQYTETRSTSAAHPQYFLEPLQPPPPWLGREVRPAFLCEQPPRFLGGTDP